MRDPLEGRIVPQIVDGIGEAAEAPVAPRAELDARGWRVALGLGRDVGERLGEDRRSVHDDVEEVRTRAGRVVAVPRVDDGQQEVERDRVVRGQPGQREHRRGSLPGGRIAQRRVTQELAVEEIRDAVEGSGVREVVVLADQTGGIDRRHVAGGGDRQRRRGEGQRMGGVVRVGDDVDDVPRVAEQRARRDHLLARRAERIPGQDHAGAAEVLEHLHADRVEARGQDPAGGQLEHRVQPAVVDDQRAVDEQPAAVVAVQIEGHRPALVDALRVRVRRVIDPDLSGPARREHVAVGDTREAAARDRVVDLGIHPGQVGCQRVEVRERRDGRHARQVEVLADQTGVRVHAHPAPLRATEHDVDRAGRRRDARGGFLGHGDRDVADAVSVEIARRADLRVVRRRARQDGRGHLQRDRWLHLRGGRIGIERQPVGGAEGDAREAPRLSGVGGIDDRVAHRDDRVVEAVAVDVAERDEHGLATQLDRREGRDRLVGGHRDGLAERILEVDLVVARAEGLDQRAAGHERRRGARVAERPEDQGAVVPGTGQVAELMSRRPGVGVVGLFESPVADEAGLVAAENPLEVVQDVRLRPRGVPDPDLVQGALERRVVRRALEGLAEAQRAGGVRARIARADAARRDQVPVEVRPHRAGVAVHHAGEVVPLTGLDREARRVDDAVLEAAVGRVEVQEAAPVQPQAVGALGDRRRRGVALVDDRHPVLAGPEVERAIGVLRHVDLEPQLDGRRADQVEARVGGDRDAVVGTVELHRVAHLGRVRGRLELGGDVQEIEVRHAGEALARDELHRLVGIRDVLGREQEGAQLLPRRHERAFVVHDLAHVDHVAGQQRGRRLAEAADGLGRRHDVPVARVAEMDVEAIDRRAGPDGRQLGRERHEVVAVGRAGARDELVGIRLEDVITGQQVAARTAADPVVATATEHDVGAGAAVQRVVHGPAEQPIVAVATVDLQGADERALLEVAGIDAVLALGVRVLEAGIAVHDVVAGARVDDGLLDAHRLVEDEVLDEHRRARRERLEAEDGDGRIVGLGPQLQALAGGAQPQEPVGELHRHLAGTDRRVDGGLEVLGELGDGPVRRRGRGRQPHLRERRPAGQPQIEDRVHGIVQGIADLTVHRRPLRRVDDVLGHRELLVGDVPGQRRELVPVQEPVPPDRHVVGHRPAQAIEIAAEEQHPVLARSAVHVVGERRDERRVRALDEGQAVRLELEGVVARLAEQEVFRLPVEAARDHVVARTTEDPVLARSALQRVVALAADDDVLPPRVGLAREAHHLGSAAVCEVEGQVVDRGHAVRRRDPNQEVGARGQAGQRQRRAPVAGKVQHGLAELGSAARAPNGRDRDAQVVPGHGSGDAQEIATRGEGMVFQPHRDFPLGGRRPADEHLSVGVQQLELQRRGRGRLDERDAIVVPTGRGQLEAEHVDVGGRI